MNDYRDVPLSAARPSFDSIPVVSLAPWFSGGPDERLELAIKLNSICRSVGFMYISDHGIPRSTLRAVFDAAEEFFALSEDAKLEVHFSKSNHHRGYIPLGAESTDPAAKADQKEAFDCGSTYIVDADKYPEAALIAATPNLWPSALPRFRDDVECYLESVTDLARTLFTIWAVGFGLPEKFFEEKLDAPIAQLRLLHYPAVDGPVDRDHMGIGAHCDYECLTIVAQDDVGGLQVMNLNGQWVEAPPVEDTLVVNIGEMMARWTNDFFIATPHRVVNRARRARYSVPFFFATNYDTVINCLPTCVSPGYPARYESVVAGQYLAKRLEEIYGL